MLKNENIICISSIDWDFVWQGHQEIMSTFAKNGNRVLFIENTGIRTPRIRDISRLKNRIIHWVNSVKGFRRIEENLFVYSPIILPFPYSKIARIFNRYLLLRPIRRWMKATDFYDPIIWTFLPTNVVLDIMNELDTKLLVYYCIADFNKLTDNPKKLETIEKLLIKKCDIIFVQNDVLAKKCKGKNNNFFIFPFGVNTNVFDNFNCNLLPYGPEDLQSIKKPIIGYVGGIHKHIDFELIKYLAKLHPEWSIVLIGPLQTDVSELAGFRNIFLLGKKEFAQLPGYIDEFDVGIIPYKITGYTESVYPTKLNEYHAMGKPVVSTELPEVVKFNNENENIILIGRKYDAFVNCILSALGDKNVSLRNKRIESAKKNNWPERIEQMSDLLHDTIEKKAKSSFNWKKKFLRLYKSYRNKVINIGAVVLSVYLLLYYTPLMWYVASPLKISQIPQKADCIVVFAGGVGESGKAEQGY